MSNKRALLFFWVIIFAVFTGTASIVSVRELGKHNQIIKDMDEDLDRFYGRIKAFDDDISCQREGIQRLLRLYMTNLAEADLLEPEIIVCPRCNGQGSIAREICPTCKGLGVVEATIEQKIKPLGGE